MSESEIINEVRGPFNIPISKPLADEFETSTLTHMIKCCSLDNSPIVQATLERKIIESLTANKFSKEFLICQDIESKMTILMHAIKNCTVDVVEELLKIGVDVGAKDQYGKSALMYSIEILDIDKVKLMINHGAKVIDADEKHKSVLNYMMETKNNDIIDYFLDVLIALMDTEIQNNLDVEIIDHIYKEFTKTLPLEVLKTYVKRKFDELKDILSDAENHGKFVRKLIDLYVFVVLCSRWDVMLEAEFDEIHNKLRQCIELSLSASVLDSSPPKLMHLLLSQSNKPNCGVHYIGPKSILYRCHQVDAKAVFTCINIAKHIDNMLVNVSISGTGKHGTYFQTIFAYPRYCPIVMFGLKTISSIIMLVLTVQVLREYNSSHSRGTLYTFIISSVVFEIGQLHDVDLKLKKFFNFWNTVDVLSLSLLFCWMIVDMKRHIPWYIAGFAKVCLAISTIPQSFGMLQVFSLNKNLGKLVIMIVEMMGVVTGFLLVLTVSIIGFGFALQGLFIDSSAVGFETGGAVVITLFESALGGFSFSNFDNTPFATVGYILLALYLTFVTIVLLNLLIARLSSKHDDIDATVREQWLHHKMQIVLDYTLVYEHSVLRMMPPPFNLLTALFLPLYWMNEKDARKLRTLCTLFSDYMLATITWIPYVLSLFITNVKGNPTWIRLNTHSGNTTLDDATKRLFFLLTIPVFPFVTAIRIFRLSKFYMTFDIHGNHFVNTRNKKIPAILPNGGIKSMRFNYHQQSHSNLGITTNTKDIGVNLSDVYSTDSTSSLDDTINPSESTEMTNLKTEISTLPVFQNLSSQQNTNLEWDKKLFDEQEVKLLKSVLDGHENVSKIAVDILDNIHKLHNLIERNNHNLSPSINDDNSKNETLIHALESMHSNITQEMKSLLIVNNENIDNKIKSLVDIISHDRNTLLSSINLLINENALLWADIVKLQKLLEHEIQTNIEK